MMGEEALDIEQLYARLHEVESQNKKLKEILKAFGLIKMHRESQIRVV